MVVDTSAVIAILEGEPDAERFIEALVSAPYLLISAATLLECRIVALVKRGQPGVALVDELIERSGFQVVPVTEELANVALEGYARYGKGRHAARLNFGDCFAYALAKGAGEPLLFKGNDFSLTDVAPIPGP